MTKVIRSTHAEYEASKRAMTTPGDSQPIYIRSTRRIARAADWLNRHKLVSLALSILFIFAVAFALVYWLPCFASR